MLKNILISVSLLISLNLWSKEIALSCSVKELHKFPTKESPAQTIDYTLKDGDFIDSFILDTSKESVSFEGKLYGLKKDITSKYVKEGTSLRFSYDNNHYEQIYRLDLVTRKLTNHSFNLKKDKFIDIKRYECIEVSPLL